MLVKNKSQYFQVLTFDKYVKFKALQLFFYELLYFDSLIRYNFKEIYSNTPS